MTERQTHAHGIAAPPGRYWCCQTLTNETGSWLCWDLMPDSAEPVNTHHAVGYVIPGTSHAHGQAKIPTSTDADVQALRDLCAAWM